MNSLTNNVVIKVSFVGAVSAAILGSLGTAAISKKITFNKLLQAVVFRISPYIGVSVANVANLAFSRMHDFKYYFIKHYS